MVGVPRKLDETCPTEEVVVEGRIGKNGLATARGWIRSLLVRSRSLLPLLAVLAGLTSFVGEERAARAESEASPTVEDNREIAVGMRLVAIDDVNLREAALSKGARVNVTKVVVNQGRVSSVDVELADGHVLRRIAIDKIRKAFAIAAD